jgi:hypothetical protein
MNIEILQRNARLILISTEAWVIGLITDDMMIEVLK